MFVHGTANTRMIMNMFISYIFGLLVSGWAEFIPFLMEYGTPVGFLSLFLLIIILHNRTGNSISRLGNIVELGFERSDRKIEELRHEMNTEFHKVRHEMEMGFEKADRKLENEIKDLRTELKGDIKDLRTELKGEINDVRTELKNEIKDVRNEMKEGFTKKDHEVEKIYYEIEKIYTILKITKTHT